MINTVVVIGNLGGNPETRYFGNEDKKSVVSKFTLYVNETYRDSAGEKQQRTDRIPVEVWGASAEFAHNYLQQGSRVAVHGSLREQRWQDNGENRSRLVLRGRRIENLTPKSEDERTHVADETMPEDGF